MSELLKKAIAAVTNLPDTDQDEIARMMLAMSTDDDIAPVPSAHAEAVAEGLAQARAGEFAADDDLKAAWRRFDP
jgi:hypothetical protein